jgi:hypothetical protein
MDRPPGEKSSAGLAKRTNVKQPGLVFATVEQGMVIHECRPGWRVGKLMVLRTQVFADLKPLALQILLWRALCLQSLCLLLYAASILKYPLQSGLGKTHRDSSQMSTWSVSLYH